MLKPTTTENPPAAPPLASTPANGEALKPGAPLGAGGVPGYPGSPDGMPPPGTIFQRLDLSPGFPYTLRYYIRRFAWEYVQATLIRYSPRRANGWRRFWLNLFGAKIHPTAITKATTKILLPWDFEMGAHSCVAEGVLVWGAGKIRIGHHTIVSQDVFLCLGGHDYSRANLPIYIRDINIGSGVWIGAKAWISAVTIGDNAVVGACAVVSKDVPPNTIAAGNPAKNLKPRKMIWDNTLPPAPPID